jgi:hypothetical protein
VQAVGIMVTQTTLMSVVHEEAALHIS